MGHSACRVGLCTRRRGRAIDEAQTVRRPFRLCRARLQIRKDCRRPSITTTGGLAAQCRHVNGTTRAAVDKGHLAGNARAFVAGREKGVNKPVRYVVKSIAYDHTEREPIFGQEVRFNRAMIMCEPRITTLMMLIASRIGIRQGTDAAQVEDCRKQVVAEKKKDATRETREQNSSRMRRKGKPFLGS